MVSEEQDMEENPRDGLSFGLQCFEWKACRVEVSSRRENTTTHKAEVYNYLLRLEESEGHLVKVDGKRMKSLVKVLSLRSRFVSDKNG